MRASIAYFTVFAILSGCGSGAPVPQNRKATLQGVISSTTGIAMPGVRASVTGSTATTLTDLAGRFSLRLDASGPATLELESSNARASVAVPRIGKGQIVRVAVRMSDDGHAELENEPEAELSGTIDSLAAPDLVVAGQTVHTDANTEFRIGGVEGTFADLKQGEQVEVEGVLQTDGSILAREIEAEVEEAPENQVKIRGTIDSISAPDLVVAGKTVHTDAQTRIEINGQPKTLADLKPGDFVEVEGQLQPDGSVLAAKIEAEEQAEPQNEEVDLRDTITAASATEITVAGVRVHADASTRIEINGEAAPFSALAVGDAAEVKGLKQQDGTVLASEIKATTPQNTPPPAPVTEVELRGTVSAISGADLTVAGHLVHTNTLTEFDGNGASSLADIKVNALVEVRGSLESDGSILAARVKLED